MSTTARARRILHVDLAPFFVAVERSLDPALRGVPVVVGGAVGSPGVVAAASDEACRRGVRAGLSIARARELCPEAVLRRGDFETYAHVSEEVSAVLLAGSRRVERPSVDEAYVDLTPAGAGPRAVPAAEAIKDALQRQLGLDASLGLASSRVAARVASRGARPRGLLLLLPGYEAAFLSSQPLEALPALSSAQAAALRRTGILTFGQLVAADEECLASAVGRAPAARLLAAIRGEDEAPIEVAAPPAWVQEELQVHDRRADRAALLELLGSLGSRAARRLRPFGLGAHSLSVEVRRRAGGGRRQTHLQVPLAGERATADCARHLAAQLLDSPAGIRSLHVRLGQLAPPDVQRVLFPERPPTVAG